MTSPVSDNSPATRSTASRVLAAGLAALGGGIGLVTLVEFGYLGAHFRQVFADFGAPLPALAQMLLAASAWVNNYGIILAAFGLAFTAALAGWCAFTPSRWGLRAGLLFAIGMLVLSGLVLAVIIVGLGLPLAQIVEQLSAPQAGQAP